MKVTIRPVKSLCKAVSSRGQTTRLSSPDDMPWEMIVVYDGVGEYESDIVT